MKTVVVYMSKTGFARRYAQWMLKSCPPLLTSDQKGMLTAYSKPADFIKKKYIDPLVA